MKKRLFYLALLFVGFTTEVWAQSAVLTRGGEPVAAFSGPASLTNAVNAAEASGDVIVLSSGTYSNPGEIKKSVSIYGQGYADVSTRTYISGKLQYRSNGVGTLDGIHLEGLYLESHFNLLNDNNRSPMNNLTVEKCHINGMFIYMDHDGTTLRNCVLQGDLKSYPGTYKTTQFLIENCWKDGGSFNCFTADSDITFKNCIINHRSLSGFDNSSYYVVASFENCVLNGGVIAANSTLTNCALINVNTSASGVTTTDCTTAAGVSDVFDNVSTLAYADGVVPVVQSTYVGSDGTPIGITGGTLEWSTTPAQATMNLSTTLTKDTDGFYQIGSVADWVEFKRIVENVNPAINAKMTADIDLGDVQAMVGNGHYNNANYRRAFGGIFDGQGHTLTIHFVTDSIQQQLLNAGYTVPSYLGAAPFGYVWGGTIRNLHTAGSIIASIRYAAGIVGWTNGSVLIENCHSSVNITFPNDNYGMAGIACDGYNDSPVLTIRDCIYDGTMTAGNDKRYSAGLVIYRDYGPINFINTLSIATYANGLGASGCATFVRNGLGGGVISNSFYKTALGEAQGVQTTADELANGRTAFYLQNGRSELVWGQEIGVDPQPVLTSDESKRVYRSATGYTNNPAEAIADQGIIPLTYTIDSNNALTITGFDSGFTPPAGYDLVIPDEIDGHPVVAIGASAFFQKSNFTSLHIGKNVQTIGNEAFRQAKGMVSVTFDPAGVVSSFGNSAFRGCDELTSFTMPNTVTTIGEMCFQADPKLASVTLSNQLTALAPNTFNGCPVLNNVVIPASVTNINTNAFYGCTSLTAITIPNTVTTMGTSVFQGCTALSTVTFADGCRLTTLPDNTFYQCTSLNGVSIPSSVRTIGGSAFSECSGLTGITIPSNVTTINNNAFYRSGLVSVILPSTITSMGSSCFAGSALTSAQVQCATLGVSTFASCASLESVTLASGVINIGNNAFQGCSKLPSISIPATVTTIGTSAFAQCSLLETATFADGINLATIPATCFFQCYALGSITIPTSVTTIANEAFRQCNTLTEVNFPTGTQVSSFGSSAFRGCHALTSFTMPNTVTTIGDMCFQASELLADITLSNQLTALAENTFNGCSALNNLLIPSSVKTIGNSAFYACTSLTSIIIPNTVTAMGTSVFQGSTALATATFEDGCQLTAIPNNTFYQCTALQTIAIPASVNTIGNSAFRYCSSLNNVTLPGHLTSIQDWSFANCTSMSNLTVEEGVTSINRDVFQYSGMKKVVLPASIGTLGINLFYQCNQLDTLDFSKCVNVWDLYYYTSLRGSNTLTNGVPTTTKIILPPYTKATLGANDERLTIDFDLAQDNLGYYLIADADDWDKFVAYSRANPTINGRLTADINLTGHVGKIGVGNDFSNYIAYEGTFDGQYHKVTLNNKTNKNITGGLFSWVKNANIQRLFVDGNIETEFLHTGGFVGGVVTALTMNDCASRVHITGHTATSKNMYIGGFVGHGGNQYAVQLTDCLFSGNIDGGTNVGYVAPLVGWTDSSRNTVYTNCLNNGTFNANPSSTYVLGDGQYITAISCYYKSGTYSSSYLFGTAVSTEQLATGQTTYRLQGGRTEQHWGQIIGTDPAPRLTQDQGTMVYRGNTYTNEYVDYAGLQKDSDDYYLIGGTADWEEFCLVVQDFPLSNARMTADVVVTDNSMVGTSTVPYSGTFDGQGHKLTVNYVATGNYCAPFLFINGATIRNLHTDGQITIGYRFGGGVVASSKGTNTVETCWSSVNIVSSYNGDATHGGLVAYQENGTLNINNCLFTGSIIGTLSYRCGGLIGYRNGTLTLENSLCVPDSIDINEYDCGTLVRNGGGTVTNCYYTRSLNNRNQGEFVTAEQLASGYVTYKLQGKNDSLVWAQTLETDSIPQLVIFNPLAQRVYRGLDGYSNNPESGVLRQDAEGYYLLSNVSDWKLFALLVDEGEYDAKARMTADINLGDDQTMIGSGSTEHNHGTGNVLYQGIFDGQGHTLTVNYNTTELFVAPFRHIKTATIKNLRVAGSITTTNRYAGGIVSACYGQDTDSYITNCVSSVNITSNYVNTGDFYGGARTGGMVACLFYYTRLHFTDCLFNGSISGENRSVVWGGLLGMTDGSVWVDNCLQNATFNFSNACTGGNGSGSLVTSFTNGTAYHSYITNSFYVSLLGNAQGTQATAVTLADGTVATALQAGRSEDIWVQDETIGQPMLKLFVHTGANVDIPLLLDILLGKVSASLYPEADLNGDGNVTLADLTLLVNQMKQ